MFELSVMVIDLVYHIHSHTFVVLILHLVLVYGLEVSLRVLDRVHGLIII